MDIDKTQRAMVNIEIARDISKMAAFAQILDAVVGHQPTIQKTEGADYNSISLHHKVRFKVIDELETIFARIPLWRRCKPLSAFNYPVGKKPTSQHVEQMRRAEVKLDAFWEQVDKYFVPQTGKTIISWMGHRLNAREIYRTQPWSPDDQKPVHGSVPVSIYQPFLKTTPDIIDTIPPEPKKKQKTRGEIDPSQKTFTAEPTNTPATIPQAPQLPPRAPQTFSLPSKFFKTMSASYPTSVEDRTSRKVIWKDFLHAMYSLNLRIEKRHGSEWYSEPSWKRDTPITIHEPHPPHEMPFDKIRFKANRIARKYG